MKSVLVETKDQIVHIRLNRPERGNAFDPTMLAELTHAFESAPQAGDARAIYLSGAGRHFCSGADLNWMRSAVTLTAAENNRDGQCLSQMYSVIQKCELPIIAEIHGSVFGGGMGLVASCDIVACLPNTVFALPEARLGLVPGVITPLLLRKIAYAKFTELAFTGRTVAAQEAIQLGLVSFCGKKDEVDQFLLETFQQIKKNSAASIRQIKKTMQSLQGIPETLFHDLAQVTATLRVSADAQARMQAFLEKDTAK
jgi:methylglutaconyl-CoA hydratase